MSRNISNPQPSDTYQTGPTRPPKTYSGLVCFLLGTVIFLGGITSGLGLMNIRLFQSEPNGSGDAGLSFSGDPQDAHASNAVLSGQRGPFGPLSLELQAVPETDAGTKQDIYAHAVSRCVTVLCDDLTGTGVVLSEDGYLLVNYHLIRNTSSLQIQLPDARILPATLVGTDAATDLAVLHVDAALPPAAFGVSDTFRDGDAVFGLGASLLDVESGRITDPASFLMVNGNRLSVVSTDLASGGGPLFNAHGQVVGMRTQQPGFAVPSATLRQIACQLAKQGYVSGRPTLGIACEEVDTLWQYYSHLPQGLYIAQVSKEAAQQGMCVGDVLIRINGTRVADTDTLEQIVGTLRPGEGVQLTFYRSGKLLRKTITVCETN